MANNNNNNNNNLKERVNEDNKQEENKKRKPYAIRLPRGEAPPRAIVFVFGWAFSRMKDVLKYSELYEDRGCATITGILDPRSVAVKNDKAIADFVNGAMKEAADLIRTFEAAQNAVSTTNRNKIPVLVHALCNGGGFCRMGLHEALATTRGDEGNDDPNKGIIRDRLATEILDSAPVYISTTSSLAALAGVVKNPLVFLVLAIGGTLANYAKYFWSLLSEGEAFYVTYWNKMKESDACPHQFFVYSEADRVCDHQKVDEFIERRRAKGKGTVKVMKVTDTGHCHHLQGHRKEYCDIVDTAIERAVAEMEDRGKGMRRSRL